MSHTIGAITARSSAATSPITVASTVVAADETVLVVMLKTNGATDRAGGALTYGSQTMTQAGTTQKAVTTPEASAELWYLVNPTVGSATLTIPNTGSLTVFYQIVRAKAPAGGASQFSATWGTNATSTNPSCGSGVLPSGGNIVFGIVAGRHQDMTRISAQTGTIIYETDDGTTGSAAQYLIVDTPVPQGQAMSWTHATSEDWGAVAAAFSERPAVSFNNYLAVNVGEGMGTTDRIR